MSLTSRIPVAARGAMAFGDWEPTEEYEEYVETGGWNLDEIHPETCSYTLKASPPERLEHYRTRRPFCEFFKCEGFNVRGRWVECEGMDDPLLQIHIHREAKRAVFELYDNGFAIHLCDRCILETWDPKRTLQDVIRRNDEGHCLECDYNAEPDCKCHMKGRMHND